MSSLFSECSTIRPESDLSGLPTIVNELDDFRFQRAIDFLAEMGRQIDHTTIWLDLGCHQGQFLRKLIAVFGVRALGSDVWEAGLKSPDDSGWEYRQADLDQEMPWSEPVDVVSAFEILEHMIDTDGFLRRVHDILKPNGWLVISTPNINSLRNRVLVPFGHYPTGLEYRTVIHHVRLYNAEVLGQHLDATGFTNVRCRGVAFLPLKSSFGTGRASQQLANRFPNLCSNIMAVAQKP